MHNTGLAIDADRSWWSGRATACLCMVMALWGTAGVNAQTEIPPVSEQYTMFYYKDLAAPRHFYGEILGLQPTYEDEWVTLYRVVPGALVGVVREGGTAQHPARPENSVMLSIVTSDIDAWNRRLKSFPGVHFIKELYDHDSAPIRALLVTDPGGYTVEMFQWLER